MFRPSSIVFSYSFYLLLYLLYLVVSICCILLFSIFAVRVIIKFSSVQFTECGGGGVCGMQFLQHAVCQWTVVHLQ